MYTALQVSPPFPSSRDLPFSAILLVLIGIAVESSPCPKVFLLHEKKILQSRNIHIFVRLEISKDLDVAVNSLTGLPMCCHNNFLLHKEEACLASWFEFVKCAQCVESMRWCLEEENEILSGRRREGGNRLIRKEDRSIRGCVATEIVD